MRSLRELCDEHGLLLILDEVQSGVGRSGKFFSHEWSGITPDIMAVAKGIGGGFPLGACLATAEAASGMKAGSHGSTYGGNPLAMAVGGAVLDVILAEGFLQHVNDVSLVFRQGLASLKDRYPDIIEEVRGQGLLLGIKAAIPAGELLHAIRAEHLLGFPPATTSFACCRLSSPLPKTPAKVSPASSVPQKHCAPRNPANRLEFYVRGFRASCPPRAFSFLEQS